MHHQALPHAAQPDKPARAPRPPAADTPPPRRAITPRKPRFDFSAVPRHWLGGNAIATALSNAVNLLFPAGERFFVRSVKHYLDDIDDDELKTAVRGFFAQEGRHAAAHEAFFAAMREQGYEIDSLLDFYQDRAYKRLEPMMPPVLRLATTAAAEHYTAIMAEGALAEGLLEHADPTMRHLLLWHAAEEIEHKSVAFDVLSKVDPRYSVRLAGLAIATAALGTFWLIGLVALLRQDKLSWRRISHDIRQAKEADPREDSSVLKNVFARGIREYLRRDFHPDDNDNYDLAADYLERTGLAERPAGPGGESNADAGVG